MLARIISSLSEKGAETCRDILSGLLIQRLKDISINTISVIYSFTQILDIQELKSLNHALHKLNRVSICLKFSV